MMILTITLMCGASLYADEQFRLALDVASDFAEKPTLTTVKTSFDDQAAIFYGLHWEVLIDRLGFGMHYLVKFDRLLTGYDDPLYDWSLDWSGDLFATFHPFGGGSFLDPFVEIGFGNVGRVDIDDDAGYWDRNEDGEWEYIYEWEPNSDAVSNLSLFPHAGVGLALDLDGLLIGLRIAYRPFVIPIPATQFADYPLESFEATFFGGFAIGGH